MALAVHDAVVRYPGAPAAAVAGVSLTVAPGELVALLGPSGCGKSSLLRAIVGLEPLASGRVCWDGHDLAGVPVHRRGFGLLFQDGQLFAHRDVAGNVAYGLRGASRVERAGRVAELLGLVGLAGYGRRAISTLSGGERQRVALARSLAPRPRLLLLDEPLSALDRGLRERLAADLRSVLVATGTTAVFVTHDHDEAFVVADRVAVMDAGRLLQVATPHALWTAPASRRVAAFLGYQAFVPMRPDLPWSAGTRPAAAPAAEGSRAADPSRAADGSRAADSSRAADGPGEVATVAVGPRGFVVPGPSHGWPGVVVATAFRRGTAEVTVDVELPAGASGVEAGATSGAGRARPGRRGRVIAMAPAHDASFAVGHPVRLGLDGSGCALLVPR